MNLAGFAPKELLARWLQLCEQQTAVGSQVHKTQLNLNPVKDTDLIWLDFIQFKHLKGTATSIQEVILKWKYLNETSAKQRWQKNVHELKWQNIEKKVYKNYIHWI